MNFSMIMFSIKQFKEYVSPRNEFFTKMLIAVVYANIIGSLFLCFILFSDRSTHVVLSVSTLCSILFVTLIAFFVILITLSINLKESRMASIDSLTNLNNRRYLDNVNWFSFQGNELSIITMDVDRFKIINDSYGHNAGDRLLKAVSSIINKYKCENVFAIRMGGDEIIIVLINSTLYTATNLVLKIQKEVRGIKIEGVSVPITISAGVSHTPYFDGSIDEFNFLLKKADIELYNAKREGRDKVYFQNTLITP